MYVLELGGEDDAFARREAESACTDVRALAAGLALARGVTDRVRGLAFTRRASELVGTCRADRDSAVALLGAAALDRTGSVAVRARDVRSTTGVSTRTVERELGRVLVERGFTVDLEDPDHELRACFAAGAGNGARGVDGDDAGGERNDERGNGKQGNDERENGEQRDATTADAGGADGGEDGDRGVCALGWLAHESVRDFGDRRPTDRPFFQPGSMDPLLARALANVAGARPGARVVDLMCGTGGLLVEAGLVGADVVGVDAQRKMVRGARTNLARYLDTGAETGDDSPVGTGSSGTDDGRRAGPGTEGGDADGALGPPGGFETVRGDATRPPLADGSADGVVFDAPYGRQSPIANRSLDALVGDALAAAARLASRAVVVGDRPWRDAATHAGWTVESAFRRRVHRSLTRHVLVLDRAP